MIIWEHPHIIPISRRGSFKVVAFSDVHFGAKACNIKRFERQVIAENAGNEDAYFLGIGDMLDLIGQADPRYRWNEGDERESFIDKQVGDFCSLFVKHKIPPHRIIGFGVGNHEDTVRRKLGSDPTQRICDRLGTKNLGYTAFIKLLTRTRSGNLQMPTVIFAQHGFAGGRKEGSSVNAYTDHAFRHPGAKVYLYGHNHKKWSLKVPTVTANWHKMEQADGTIVVGDCGTYMMTYSKGPVPNYAEKKGAYPVELGHLEIIYTHRREVARDENNKRRATESLGIRVLD